MDRRDGGLDVIWAQLDAGSRKLQEMQAFAEPRLIPQRASLIAQRSR